MKASPGISLRLKLTVLLAVAILSGCETEEGHDPVFSITDVPVWEVRIPQEQYRSLLENKWGEEQAGADITTDGIVYRGYMEPQGAGSRYISAWSFKVEMEEGTTIAELPVFNLSSQWWDHAFVRTTLANALFEKAGFIGFQSFPVYFRLNGENLGLYTVIERIEEEYFQRHPQNSLYELIKVGFEAKFTFKDGALKMDKSFDKKFPKDDNFTFLADFFHALDETSSEDIFAGLNKYLDIEQYLRYHALSSLINHKDGFANNFYFYRSSQDAPYQIIPWDYDQTFSLVSDVEYAGTNDIFERLIENDSCAAYYRQQLKFLLDSVMTEDFCFPIIDANAQQIAAAYQLSPMMAGQGYDVFDEAAKLKTYITNRRNYFHSLLAD